ncbi:MAG: hypothetical protein ACK43M_22375 [Allorhizobium sp.]
MSKTAKTERVPIMFDPELLSKLDDFSFANRIRTRSQAIRLLVERGVSAKTTSAEVICAEDSA